MFDLGDEPEASKAVSKPDGELQNLKFRFSQFLDWKPKVHRDAREWYRRVIIGNSLIHVFIDIFQERSFVRLFVRLIRSLDSLGVL